jgi:Viral nucleic acid binding
MHTYDFTILCCLYKMQPFIPPGIREKIFDLTKESRQEWRKQEQQLPFCGESASSKKRSSRRYGKCIGCGKVKHQGDCKLGQTEAQFEYTILMKMGPIRLACTAERLIRDEGVVHERILDDFDYIREQTGIEPEAIRDELVARQNLH